jgi:hypothetical protein
MLKAACICLPHIKDIFDFGEEHEIWVGEITHALLMVCSCNIPIPFKTHLYFTLLSNPAPCTTMVAAQTRAKVRSLIGHKFILKIYVQLSCSPPPVAGNTRGVTTVQLVEFNVADALPAIKPLHISSQTNVAGGYCMLLLLLLLLSFILLTSKSPALVQDVSAPKRRHGLGGKDEELCHRRVRNKGDVPLCVRGSFPEIIFSPLIPFLSHFRPHL